MVNKKYVAVAVIVAVIIIASAGFLVAQSSDDAEKCKVCGMPNCTMDHSNSTNNSNSSHNMSDEMENMNMSK